MTRSFNLPPGVCANDLDPIDVCRECEGSGEIENPDFGKPGYESEAMYLPCPTCVGIGVENTRGAFMAYAKKVGALREKWKDE